MARIEVKCPTCGKKVPIVRQTRFGKTIWNHYRCGHASVDKLVIPTIPYGEKLICLDCKVTVGSKRIKDHLGHNTKTIPINRDHRWLDLYEYQREAVLFGERSQIKFLDGDEMGLGKSVISSMILRYNYEIMKPCIIICPAGLIYNWRKEIMHWVTDKYHGIDDLPIIHTSGDIELLDDQNIHIVSNMLISRPIVYKSIMEYGFKSAIVDESHHFKNDRADRTSAMIKIAGSLNHLILLSGTSIINRTSEYYNSLHMLNPRRWYNKGVLTRICLRNDDGKPLCINPRWKEWFFTETSQYVIRRTKKELFKSMPPIEFNKKYVNVLDSKSFVNQYNDELEWLDKLLNMKRSELADYGGTAAIIVALQKLWEITAVAKSKHLIPMVHEFMENTEPEDKLAIGAHHVTARDILSKALSKYSPRFILTQSAKIKEQEQEEFRKPENRLLIASLLGAGEGRNLQFCKNVIFLERYWNPAKERQFWSRFYARGENPEVDKEHEPVIVDYLLAAETIDEYFTEMNDLKANIEDQALDKEFFADPNQVFELAQRVVHARLKYVGA